MTTPHALIKEVEKEYLKSDIPAFRPGDTIRVAVRVKEGNKERIQNFEGVCISRKGEGVSETITVRRVSFGVGIERIFPLHSPRLESITIVRAGRVRRAKLYYLRNLRGKAARIPDLVDKPGRGTRIVTVKDDSGKRKKRGKKAKAERAGKDTAVVQDKKAKKRATRKAKKVATKAPAAKAAEPAAEGGGDAPAE